VPTLREEWLAIRSDARSLSPGALPTREAIADVWTQLKAAAARENRTVFETSSTLALAAVRGLPDGVRWLSASAMAGAARTGQVMASSLLDYYKRTLDDVQREGYRAYTARQLRPYVRAAASQFSPARRTLTQRLLDRIAARRQSFRRSRQSP
jgi:hypothetical protein